MADGRSMGQGKGIGFWDIGDNRGGNYEDLVAMHKVFKMYMNVDFVFVVFLPTRRV